MYPPEQKSHRSSTLFFLSDASEQYILIRCRYIMIRFRYILISVDTFWSCVRLRDRPLTLRTPIWRCVRRVDRSYADLINRTADLINRTMSNWCRIGVELVSNWCRSICVRCRIGVELVSNWCRIGVEVWRTVLKWCPNFCTNYKFLAFPCFFLSKCFLSNDLCAILFF